MKKILLTVLTLWALMLGVGFIVGGVKFGGGFIGVAMGVALSAGAVRAYVLFLR